MKESRVPWRESRGMFKDFLSELRTGWLRYINTNIHTHIHTQTHTGWLRYTNTNIHIHTHKHTLVGSGESKLYCGAPKKGGWIF